MRFWGRLEKQRENARGSLILLSLLMLLVSGVPANAQHSGVSKCEVRFQASSRRPTESALPFREIDDPYSGARWLVVRDSVNPGGPGRMELAQPGRGSGAEEKRAGAQSGGQAKPVPMIRPGDRLVVEEHTATAEAYLEGVALETAVNGATLKVRLMIGGKVVRAIAVAPGRAALAAVAEARR